MDPARIINREIDAFDEGERQALTGRTLLTALRRGGWRVVRLSAGDSYDETLRIDEEWLP